MEVGPSWGSWVWTSLSVVMAMRDAAVMDLTI